MENNTQITEQTQNEEQKQIETSQETKKDFGVPQHLTKKNVPKFLVGKILRIEEINLNFSKYLGQVVEVAGWARTVRSQAELCFIELSDGSTFNSLQIVVEKTMPNFQEVYKSGVAFSFRIKGLIVESPAKGQDVEMKCDNGDLHYVKILGECDQKNYPLAKKFQKPETLREIAHLRPRSNVQGAVTRVRNSLLYATHIFYQSRGFYCISTPLITASDCEGAGEMFQVTTLLPKINASLEKIPTIVDKKNPAITAEKRIDYNQDFFKTPSFLTVSGQLSVENFACALSNVYTFGPTFRAENSHTSRHLAEFWMIEPEIAFGDVNDCMDLAEDYLRFLMTYVLENCQEDLKFFDERVKKGLIEYLTRLANSEFQKVDYKDALEILVKDIEDKKVQFEQNQLKFGDDLASEHEKYLTEKIYNGPIFLYNFPKEIKSFYMKINPDNRTVAAFDCLVPQIGEIIGGSQREDNYEVLEKRMIELKLDPKDYWWYMDLRKYGTVPHSGFGAGFERLIMLCTGIENIRDTIPFPRVPGSCQF